MRWTLMIRSCARTRAWFPGLIRPFAELPRELQGHLRVPPPLLSLQAQVLGDYHLTEPRAFYEKQDVWSLATENYGDQPTLVQPTFVHLTLPGSDSREFVLTVPFVARGRQNMTALLMARNDPPHYGERLLFELPRDELVPGPQQIESLIDQDPEISQQLALWRRGGSSVIRGHLVVVPIDSSLVYVEPLFLEADNAAIPQLERVIVARRWQSGDGADVERRGRFADGPSHRRDRPPARPRGDPTDRGTAAGVAGAGAAASRRGRYAAPGGRLGRIRPHLERPSRGAPAAGERLHPRRGPELARPQAGCLIIGAARGRGSVCRHADDRDRAGRQRAASGPRGGRHRRAVSRTRARAWRRSSSSRAQAGALRSCTATARRSAMSCYRNEMARARVPPLPLGVLVAGTAGWIGYMIQQSLQNALEQRRHGARGGDRDHAGAGGPRRPCDARADEADRPDAGRGNRAHARSASWAGRWSAGDGWRRLVPSPHSARHRGARQIRTWWMRARS